MRRSLLLATAVAMATAVSAAPDVLAQSGHVVTGSYVGGGVDSPVDGVPSQYVDGHADGGAVAAVVTTPWPGERFVTVQPADTTARAVLVAVVQTDPTDSRRDVELGRVCTGQRGHFRLALGASPVTAYVLTGQCPGGLSVPTTGTVRFVFNR